MTAIIHNRLLSAQPTDQLTNHPQLEPVPVPTRDGTGNLINVPWHLNYGNLSNRVSAKPSQVTVATSHQAENVI